MAEYESRIALLSQEIERLNNVVDQKNNEVSALNNQVQEMNAMNMTINTLQDRVGRLVNENSGMENEMRGVQENLRLSTSQNQKIMMELNEYRDRLSSNEQEADLLKKKIQKLVQENSGLGEEMRNAQENIRLSNAQTSKAMQEVNEYKSRLDQLNSENDIIKRKMEGIIQENRHLSNEVNQAQ